MAQLPGQLYGLATGDFDTAAMRGPERLQEYAKSLQSQGLHVREALRDKATSEAEKRGIAAEFYTAIIQTLKDPALISTFITEQIPEMLPMLLTGGISKLFTTGATQVAKLGAKEAAENAARIATRTGIATGAVQQGADIGSDTYKEALDLAKAQYPNKSPEEIQDIALSAARSAALEAGIVSLGAQNLPGAKAIERRMAGMPGEGRIRSGLGEAAGELLEEGGGKFASNVNLQQIDPNKSLTAGVGTAAGLGAIGGGTLGAVIGHRAPEPELMPGQNYGESLAQAANRLQSEIRENEKLIRPVSTAEKVITTVSGAPIDPVVAPFVNAPQGSLFSEGNLNVGTANAAPGGEGTLLAGIPGAGSPAAGVDTTQPDGVVLIGQDAAGTAGGEGEASASVEPVILQNRNRATPASIAQMQDISARPDYTRLGFSRDITTGAPVVFGGNIPTQQLGKADVVAAGDKKIPVQYAVMNVNDVIASNNADGSIVPEYSTAVNKTRVVGGNARIAGLQNAYKNNTAAGYVAELLGDDLHGISPDVIKGVKNPVLVRVMPASEITKNIGDITNTTGTLDLSTVDQAKNDAKRIDVNEISYNEDGDVTDYSVMQFIRSMPTNEHGKLIDDDGQPTTIARARLHAAIFAQAYQNDKLLRLYSQAVDPDAKNVLNALSQAAPQMARLQGAGALDFRNDVVAAAEQVVTAKKAGISTPDMVAQVTFGEDPNVHNILTGLANNIRSAKRMARILKEAANYAYHHANTEEQDMFGEPVPKPTKEDITQGIKEGKEYPKQSKRVQKGQIDLGLTGEEEQQQKAKAQFERVATAEAPARIAEKKEQFKNILGKILSNMGLKDVAVKLMDDIESEKAEGSYSERLIKIALNADKPVRTLRHEAIHALKELGFFSDNQWKVLTKQANDVWIDKYLKNKGVGGGPLKDGEKSRYDAYMEGEEFKADPNAIIEEAIADAFGDFDATKPPPGMIQAILKRMRDFFDGLKRALNGAGFLTSDQAVEQLFGKIERGELKAGEAKAGEEKLSLRAPDTKEFKQFFDDSKVVDENGKPLVVYHYSPKSNGLFNEFDKKRITPNDQDAPYNGFWFSGKPEEDMPRGIVRAFYIALKNPASAEQGYRVARKIKNNYDLNPKYKAANSLQDAVRIELASQGFDGIIHYTPEESPGTGGTWIAFEPNQIKSATGNIGTYSKENPDIRYSLRITKDNQIPDLGKDVTVAKVGKYFDDEVKKTFGSALDYNDKVAFDRAIDTATQEVLHQMTQVKSGLDWYEEDIKTAFKDTIKIIPKLKKPESRILFTVIAGIMSPNTYARENWYITAKAFEHYVNTKEIPSINPENGMLWMGGTQSANKKLQLNFLNNMVKSLKEGPALDWLTSDHTVKEINEYRQKYGNIKSGIDGKATDVKPGLYAFGPKVGPFVSNLNGIHDVTVDKWMTRTFNRYFGTMVDREGKIIDAPTEPQRRAIKELAIKVAENVGIKPYQVQSVLWFYEQQLFTKLGANSPSYGFSDGGRRFLNERRGEGGTAGVPNAAAPNARAKLSLRDKLGLYSELENKIEAVGPNQAPAPQWKAMIKGMVQKGVKPEEIEWSGVNDYLDLQEGKVSKAALLEYLKEGGVKVEETTLRGQMTDSEREERQTRFEEEAKRKYGPKWDDGFGLTSEQQDEIYDFIDRKTPLKTTVYERGSLMLPGGANYREVLLTLPAKEQPKVNLTNWRAQWFDETTGADYEGWNVIADMPNGKIFRSEIGTDSASNETEAIAQAKEVAFHHQMTDEGERVNYKSSHWDQPNVLAHVRLNDRVDEKGNKVLFVEEVQSDWGQERKKNLKLLAEHPNSRMILKSIEKLTPNAPFIGKTEGWLNLALKRIMVLAAEGNYDKVAFINGKQSAKRYNLAAYIDTIDYEKDDQGTYEFVATDKEGKTVYEKEEISLSEIEELVGKDIAKKIEAGEGEKSINISYYRDWHTLSNVDLEVGEGKGMKVFYDQIVPIALKKLLSKVGGKELVTVDIKEPFTLRNVLHQPGFDVTPEMKQKVETTGLPKFSLRNTFSASVNAAVDRTTRVREDETWGDRFAKWIAPESKSALRAALINRYNALGIYDRRRAEKMGGFGLLADASSESAALLSDLGSSLTAAILGPDGGAPVYSGGITTLSNFGGTVKGPLQIFAELERLGKGDTEIYRYYQFWAAVNMAKRVMPSHANPQGTDITFTPADILRADEIFKQYPEFANIQKEWIKYNDKLAQYLVDTGVISQKNKDQWVKYGDYIPFYRQVDDTETIGPKLLQAIAGVKPPKKRKGGTEAPLADFLETIIRNTQSAVQMGIKNVAAQRAVLVAMDLNSAGKTDVIKPLNVVTNKPDTVTILVDGMQRSFRSNDMLWLSAITSLNLPDVPFIGIFTHPANLLRALVTKDPGFMLANMMRDSMQAMVASDYSTVNPATTLANFASALAGKSPEFKALMNAGLLGGHEYSKDIIHSGKAFARDLRKITGQKTTTETLLSPVTGLWDALEKGTTASDSATRQQIYKEVLERTKSNAYPNGNMAEAVFRAMEVMNFNRKGNSALIRILTATIPFFNARIQGLDVLYRAGMGIGTDKKSAAAIQKQFFIRGATMFALSCMYWSLTHDDDDYKKQEQETKDNYWLLPSLGVKIPIPFEIGIMFKVIPERIMAAYFGTDTGADFAKSMKRQVVNTLDVNWFMPQAIKPILETVTNHSFFTDRSIVGKGMENVAEGYQVSPTTSKIAAEIGKAAGYSPMKIDHLISGYTGTMGMYAFNLFDSIFKMNDDKTYASTRFEQTPVLKRFLIDPQARGTVTAYYETKNEVDSVVRTASLMERTMNYKEWGPYYKDNIKMIATHDYLLDLENTMKELREMRMQITSNKAEPDQKRDALANLNKLEAKLTANIQIIKKNMQ